ncbi:MAG: nucleotide pyrophosphohydrolase [Undibacterium sp.]|nr:nucleotide pyrophosphohydrolase [Opitutaceae bacterium]
MATSAKSLPQLTARARRVRDLYTAQALAAGARPWGSAELAQGFVGDVGDLMKLIMAKEGLRSAKDLDAALAHELADCLWSVLLLPDAYGVKLEPAFLTTMQHLEQKLTVPRRTKTAQTSRARQV